jgi:hypothetical protein
MERVRYETEHFRSEMAGKLGDVVWKLTAATCAMTGQRLEEEIAEMGDI